MRAADDSPLRHGSVDEPARVTATVSDSDDQQVLFSDWRING